MKKYPYLTTNLIPSAGILVSGTRSRVKDAKGRRYLDLSGQTLNLAFGHRNPTVLAHILKQLKRIWFASSRFGSAPFMELSQSLVRRAPQGITAVNLKMCDGSDAVETAVKLARLHTRERTIVCIKDAWHGETNAALGLCSLESKKELVTSETEVHFSDEATLSSLARAVLAVPNAAAVIIDPVGVSNGVFGEQEARHSLSEIRRICTERGILLIFDEVQTFGGYLGTELFAADYFGVTPDIICIGKALGSGMPIAATLCTEELRGLIDYNNAEFTYGGQPVACSAAIGALKEWDKNKKQIAANLKFWSELVEKARIELQEVEIHSIGFITTFTRKTKRHRDLWSQMVDRDALQAGILVRRNDSKTRILVKPSINLSHTDGRKALRTLISIMRHAEKRIKGGEGIFVKPAKSNKNERYADTLLRSLGPGFGVRTADALEQQIITERLAAVGVPVIQIYADDHDTTIRNFVPGVSADHYLASLKNDDYAAANAFFAHQQGALEIAHDNGMIIGDRWPGNTIVNGNSCSFIDFDIRYEGDFGKLAIFEELFSLFQCLSCLKNRSIAARIAPRFVRGIVRRYSDDVYSVWQSLKDFYDESDKPENNTSFSRETYADTLVIMQQGMNGAKTRFKLPMFARKSAAHR